MSFINLMANDVWSEADIVHRTEAELHSLVSKETELILSRKMIGFSLGLVIPSSAEQIELTAYQSAAYLAQQSGVAARADMVLLQSVLDYEKAQARLLTLPLLEPTTITVIDLGGIETAVANPAIAIDALERDAAQAVLDAASAEALALLLLRNPPPPAPATEPLP